MATCSRSSSVLFCQSLQLINLIDQTAVNNPKNFAFEIQFPKMWNAKNGHVMSSNWKLEHFRPWLSVSCLFKFSISFLTFLLVVDLLRNRSIVTQYFHLLSFVFVALIFAKITGKCFSLLFYKNVISELNSR